MSRLSRFGRGGAVGARVRASVSLFANGAVVAGPFAAEFAA